MGGPSCLHSYENPTRWLPRRLRNRVRVKRHLPAILFVADRRNLAIGLVVHDGPFSVFLERQVDDAFDEFAVPTGAGDGRFPAAGAASVGSTRAPQQIVL